MKGSDRRERSFDTAESETLGMCGNSMRENREALQTPTHDGGVGRSKKAKSRNVDMHVCGESDGLIVPTKRANKADAGGASFGGYLFFWAVIGEGSSFSRYATAILGSVTLVGVVRLISARNLAWGEK
jgi:hypothetical protein